ncbi:hypothetical protein J6590_047095 [Homalodisca vitripennis]|nr:hypothetical protein J6590_047095 [Homalodisca vitripennis]
MSYHSLSNASSFLPVLIPDYTLQFYTVILLKPFTLSDWKCLFDMFCFGTIFVLHKVKSNNNQAEGCLSTAIRNQTADDRGALHSCSVYTSSRAVQCSVMIDKAESILPTLQNHD